MCKNHKKLKVEVILVQSLIHLVEEYVVFNISAIVSNSLFLLCHQGLIYKIRATSDVGQKGYFFKKKKKRPPKISPPPVQSHFKCFARK